MAKTASRVRRHTMPIIEPTELHNSDEGLTSCRKDNQKTSQNSALFHQVKNLYRLYLQVHTVYTTNSPSLKMKGKRAL